MQQTWIDENQRNIRSFKEGVTSIEMAALQANGGRAPTGEGIDIMRLKIQKNTDKLHADFSSSRGAKNAAGNIAGPTISRL